MDKGGMIKIGLGVIAALIVALLIANLLGWVSWPFDLYSRKNVQSQFNTGYELYNSLKATAGMVCGAEDALKNASNEVKDQRQSQLSAVKNNYDRLSAQYQAWSDNIFAGNLVRPSDLPRNAPTLKELKELSNSCEK